jgi:dinuclear metal center YbgI/SA1388 family protein
MAALAELVAFLDRELQVASISDYPGAWNGLQLANDGQVDRIIAAVDASLPVMVAAGLGGSGLLLVHHGLFWQGAQPITGGFYRKLKTAMADGLAVYSSHLPLDVHFEWGNNQLLARAIGMVDPQPFFEHQGLCLGVRGSWIGTRSDLAERLRCVVGGAVHVCPGGSETVTTVGVITGAAGREVAKIAALGVDAFVTGEGPHWSYLLAEELGINVFYAGHYATETLGVQVLAQALAKEFQLPWTFIDRPTGL